MALKGRVIFMWKLEGIIFLYCFFWGGSKELIPRGGNLPWVDINILKGGAKQGSFEGGRGRKAFFARQNESFFRVTLEALRSP